MAQRPDQLGVVLKAHHVPPNPDQLPEQLVDTWRPQTFIASQCMADLREDQSRDKDFGCPQNFAAGFAVICVVNPALNDH
jgi:hypothetical protein